MKKLVCAFAILATAGVSTAAVAKDLKQDKKATAPVVAATQMSDAEMDRVTAGNNGQTFPAGFGIFTALDNPGKAPFTPLVSLGDRGSGVCVNQHNFCN